MPVQIDVTSDAKLMARDLKRIRAAIPKITSRAVNELATWARKETIRETAGKLRLPRKVIAKTTRKGNQVDRFALRRATANTPIATLTVISAGIQVSDVAGAWIGRKPGQKGGVKAKGGRFYRGTFKGKARGAGTERVWKRTGPDRKPLMLPRIGTKKAMEAAFEAKVSGSKGTALFRERFQRLAAYELAKAGIR